MQGSVTASHVYTVFRFLASYILRVLQGERRQSIVPRTGTNLWQQQQW